jgi:hypothetical protein
MWVSVTSSFVHSGCRLLVRTVSVPAHLLNPTGTPLLVTAFRLAFAGADNYLRGVAVDAVLIHPVFVGVGVG